MAIVVPDFLTRWQSPDWFWSVILLTAVHWHSSFENVILRSVLEELNTAVLTTNGPMPYQHSLDKVLGY